VKRVVITGGSSGLGWAITMALAKVYTKGGWSIDDWSLPEVDITDRNSVRSAAFEDNTQIDILINNAGTNEVNYLPNLTEKMWDRVMDTNAKGIYLVTQALLERLRGGTVLNIVSNASRVPMTSSLAYNASKGAAAIMTKQMARELKKTHGITVFSISPGKLEGTEMSKYIEGRVVETRGWTPEYAKQYQLDGLAAGKEIKVELLAEFIAFILSTKERHEFFHGQDIPYGG